MKNDLGDHSKAVSTEFFMVLRQVDLRLKIIKITNGLNENPICSHAFLISRRQRAPTEKYRRISPRLVLIT